MESLTISQSKARRWRTCKQQYHFRHVERLQRKRVKRPLQFGRIAHDLLEVELVGGDPFRKLDEIEKEGGKLFQTEIEEYGDIIEDIAVIFEEYQDFYADEPLQIIPVDNQNAEHWFEYELFPGMIFNGKIDYLCKTNKLRWLGEHKTFGSLPNDDHRWKDLQSAVYFKAIRDLGWVKGLLDGVCWNYISSKAPTVPQIKQDGDMSTRKIVTLPSVVRQVAADNKIPLEDITEQLERAEESRHVWFQRIYTPINETAAEFLWDGFVDTAHEIADNHGKLDQMNIGRHCDWCDYEAICRARMLDDDVDFVKEHEYEVRPHGDKEESSRKEKTPKRKPRKKESRKSSTR